MTNYLVLGIHELVLWPENYNEGDVGAIARSILEFGFGGFLSVWRQDDTDAYMVLSGNHTLKALWHIKKQGLRSKQGAIPPNVIVKDDNQWFVPCVDMSHLDRNEARAFAIAMNRTAALASHDNDQLLALLNGIQQDDADLLAATGYNENDIDWLLDQTAPLDFGDIPTPKPPKSDILRITLDSDTQAKWQAILDDYEGEKEKAFKAIVALYYEDNHNVI